MMVVVTVSRCPPKLRGDLTKWLIEIDTGVFVGNLNARVRDAVWERICDHIGNGRATMAFSAAGEQKLDFRIHNTEWEPVDHDGIKLVRRNYPSNDDAKYKQQSKAMQQHIDRLAQRKKKAPGNAGNYVVIDIETTGLEQTDRMIEIGAVRITDGHPEETFAVLLKCGIRISAEIEKLTGITDTMLEQEGISEEEAVKQFQLFCGDSELVGHHIMFDMKFLQSACIRNDLPAFRNKTTDTLRLSRRKLVCSGGYGLTAIADHLEIAYEHSHRALDDCMLTYRIFEKLKEM